jgi:hypothetical protein
MDEQQAARVTTSSGVCSRGRIVDNILNYILNYIFNYILSWWKLMRVLGHMGDFNQPGIWVDTW